MPDQFTKALLQVLQKKDLIQLFVATMQEDTDDEAQDLANTREEVSMFMMDDYEWRPAELQK